MVLDVGSAGVPIFCTEKVNPLVPIVKSWPVIWISGLTKIVKATFVTDETESVTVTDS